MTEETKMLTRWMERVQEKDLLQDLLSIRNNEKEIYERFYRSLEFGTGGLRGELGAGTNRMNEVVVRQASQGFAEYLKRENAHPSVAISYDSRHKSEIFARETAMVMAANGVHVYLYKELMPTPALSFAVLDRKCTGGVMVTASHNPAIFNGYKAYASDGAQISGDVANAVSANIAKIDCFDDVKTMPLEDGLKKGLIEYIGEDLINRYLDAVAAEALRPDLGKKAGFKLVYTPLNGAGRRMVLSILKRMGQENVVVVPEQEMPNGDFPTCPYPNPEILEAMQLGLNLTEKEGADLLIATDPDSDRVGAAVLVDGKPRLITGNEMGTLLLDYIAKTRIELGTMPENPVAVTTIVSTKMVDKVAWKYGVEMRHCLTGFKYIGEQIAILEKEGHHERFIFGFEESYGVLSGGYVRDKDAVNGTMLIVEMAAYYRTKGMNLAEAMDALYREFGYCYNETDSYTFKGSEGMKEMSHIMADLRENHPRKVSEYDVTSFADYERGTVTLKNETLSTGLPKSNVIALSLGDLARLTIRPSGTEPKLKVYYSIEAANKDEAMKISEDLKGAMEKILSLNVQ